MSLNGFDEVENAKEICKICVARQERIEKVVNSHTDNLQLLISLLTNRVDNLIEIVAGKQQVPLDVFKWLIIFILGFSFTIFFGVEGWEKFSKIIWK